MARIGELEKDFTRLVKSGSLSHGYLFFGGSFGAADERLPFARRIAGLLESNELVALPGSIDTMELGGGTAGIEEIREAIQFLWRRPAKARRRTLIVSDAELLNLHAMNALLKAAEEPPAHGFLIIIARDPNALLPALSSRLQRIFFSPQPLGKEPLPASVLRFLKADRAFRSEIIKSLIDDEAALSEFLNGLIRHFSADLKKSHAALRAALAALFNIRQWNVNRRLQLEAALLFV